MDSCKRCKEYQEHIYWQHNDCMGCKEYHEHIFWEHNNSRSLRFQMTMIGDFSRHISIPEKFTSNVDLPEIIDLKGPSGCSWQVGLAKRGSTVYLQYGWKEFVEAHHLVEHDVLFFGYEGVSCFRVIVYDSSGCEREFSCTARNEDPENQEETEECSVEILEPCAKAANEVVSCSSASSPNASNFPKESSPANTAQNGEYTCSRRKIHKGQKVPLQKSETDGESFHGNQSENRKSIRRPATDIERDPAMKLAGELRTNRPSFIAKMKGYNVCNQFQLIIPPDFASDFLPKKSQEIVLQIPRERKEWKVNYCIGETAARLIGKWRNFARDNILKEGDVCVFVLSKGKKKIAMTVHIFRAVKSSTSSASD